MSSQELATIEPVLEINPTPDTAPAEIPAPSYLCRHIFTDGHRCGSRALRQENFCFYHHTHRKPVLKRHTLPRHPDYGLKSLDDLEDRVSIQLTLAEVLRRLASNSIDPRRASLLLYGLQIASQNLAKQAADSATSATPDIVEDPILGHLAAPEPGRFPVPSNQAGADHAAALIRHGASQHPLCPPALADPKSRLKPLPLNTLRKKERGEGGTSNLHEKIQAMSQSIPKAPARTTGLSPKEQKLQALREKAAHVKSGAKPAPGASAQSFSAKTSFAGKKTSFQRKAV
jgi:hypothetical protein